MKTTKLILVLTLIALLVAPSALADITWLHEAKGKKLLAWDNGQLTKNIKVGDSADFTTGAFWSTFGTNPKVKLTVTLKQKGGPLISTIVPEGKSKEKVIDVSKQSGYETVTVNSSHYKNTAGHYVVTIALDDGKEVKLNSDLELIVSKDSQENQIPNIKKIGPHGAENIPTLNIEEGKTLKLEIDTDDEDKSTVTYKVNSQNAKAARDKSITTSGGKDYFSYTPGYDTVLHPDRDTEVTFTITPTDKEGLTGPTVSFKVKVIDVNRKPAIPLQDVTMLVGETRTLKVTPTDADNDQVSLGKPYTRQCLFGRVLCLPASLRTYRVPDSQQTNSPIWEVNNPHYGQTIFENGEFTFTPTIPQKHTIYVEGDDGFGGKVTSSFVLTVNANQKPTVQVPNNGKITSQEGVQYTFTVTADDPEKKGPVTVEVLKCYPQPLGCSKTLPKEVTVKEDPGKATITLNYDYTFVQHPKTSELEVLQIRATDKDGEVTLSNLEVNVQDVNRFPSFTKPPKTVSVVLNQAVTVDVEATDADAEDVATLKVTKASGPGTLTGKKFTITPTKTEKVLFEAVDQMGAKTQYEVTFTSSGNVPPQFKSLTDITTTVRTKVTMNYDATDPDGDDSKIKYTHGVSLQGETNDIAKKEVTWTPTAPGTYTRSFTATDEKGATVTKVVKITVTAGNVPPQFKSLTDITTTVRTKVTMNYDATDPDGDDSKIKYGQGVSLPGETNDVAKKEVTWTPTTPGMYTRTFSATDEKGATVTKVVKITVTAPNIPPRFLHLKDITVEDGQQATLDFTAVDPDGDDNRLVYTYGPTIPGQSSNGNVITWIAKKGTYTMTFTVTDEKGAKVTKVVTITVTDPSGNFAISSVRLQEVVRAGEPIYVATTLTNNGGRDLEDMRVSVYLPDLVIKRSSGEFTLDKKQSRTRTVVIPTDYFTEPGTYLIKVTAKNDYMHDSAYRQVIVE